MKVRIYNIYDSKAEIHSQPMFLTNDAVALRVVTNAVNTEGHNYNMNPEDYTLFYIGTYDDVTGKLDADYTSISNCLALVKGTKNK